MKICLFLIVTIICGCSNRPNTATLPSTIKMSKSQAFLIELKDSLISQYGSVESEMEKQKILDTFHQQLQTYLMKYPIDSIKVTFDEVTVKGLTVTTKSYFSSIEFNYGLTFGGAFSPRTDSIYKFMKNLKTGSDVLVNFVFTGACQVNRPNSAEFPTFSIYAFPVPLQYHGK